VIQGSEDWNCGSWVPAIPALEAAKSRNDALSTEIGIIGQLMAATNNFKNQALGTARNRVFLQPRYVKRSYDKY